MGRFERGLAKLSPNSTAARSHLVGDKWSPMVQWKPAEFVHLNTAEGNVPLDELVAMDADR